jgi:DNA gyrase subunit A
MLMITRDGYIKRIPPDTFKTQIRGGKGVAGITTKDEDVIDQVFTTTTHKDLLFFSSRGRVFQMKAYDVPEAASRTAKGQALVNFLSLAPGENVTATLSMDDMESFKHLLMVTTKGTIKKTDLSEFENVRSNGLIAIKLKDNDNLQWVRPTTGKDEIVLVSEAGQAIRFSEKSVRSMGRVAAGVRGMKLKGSDTIVGMDIIEEGSAKKAGLLHLLIVMMNGYGKRSDVTEFKLQGRGGSGIKAAAVTKKTGQIVAGFITNAKDDRDLLVVSEAGQVVRSSLSSISVLGRATQGVRIMRFKKENDTVATSVIV